MSKRFDLVFSDAKGERLRLAYQAMDTAIARRWLTVLLSASDRNDKLKVKLTGSLFVDESSVRTEIENGAREVREKTSVDILRQPLPRFSRASDLNPVRDACLGILNNESGGSQSSIEIRATVSQVIEDIARYLSQYDPDHHFHIDLGFEVQTKYFLNEKDFEAFTPDRMDGWIYLAYCQAGTPPFAAYLERSEVMPNPQNCFDTGFQLIYRESFSYPSDEKTAAHLWTANRFGRKIASAKEAIGQIPLGRPVHAHTRDEILQFLIGFDGTIGVEVFDGAIRVSEASLRKLVSTGDERFRKFHPFLVSGVQTGFVLRLIAHLNGQLWLIVQESYRLRPILWEVQFKLSAPFRKVFYVVRYFVRNHRAIIANWISIFKIRFFVLRLRARNLFSDLKVMLAWRLLFPVTRPIRKVGYFLKYVYAKYLASPTKKDIDRR